MNSVKKKKNAMNTKDDTYIAMKMEYFLKLWKKIHF